MVYQHLLFLAMMQACDGFVCCVADFVTVLSPYNGVTSGLFVTRSHTILSWMRRLDGRPASW